MQGVVSDRKNELQELEVRCSALAAENAHLRCELDDLQASHHPLNGSREGSEHLSGTKPKTETKMASRTEEQEIDRSKAQCEALRTVLRQREDEVGKERERTSQLRNAIKVVQAELARARQQLGNADRDRNKHEERSRVLQQHLDDAREQTDADSKSVSMLRAQSESLKSDLQRERNGLAWKRTLQERCRSATGADSTVISPRGADNAVRSPRSPRGPGCDKPSVPGLRLQHLAHANNANSSSLALSNVAAIDNALSAVSDQVKDGRRSMDSPRCTDDAEHLATKILDLERRLKKESDARRADQLTMMDHIKSDSMDKLKLSSELEEEGRKCCYLEGQLAEMRFLVLRKDAALRSARFQGSQEQELEDKPHHENNFFSSLFGVFALGQPKSNSTPQTPTPGMYSPRGDRISGAPVPDMHFQGHSTSYSSPARAMEWNAANSPSALSSHSSPSLVFPLNTISETSLAADWDRDTARDRDTSEAVGVEGQERETIVVATPRDKTCIATPRVLTLGGGSHSSVRSGACRISEDPMDAHDPLNMDWRVVM